MRLELDRKIEEAVKLRAEMRELEKEADKWRIDYWALYSVFFKLKLIGQVAAQSNPDLAEQIEAVLAPHEASLKEIGLTNDKE